MSGTVEFRRQTTIEKIEALYGIPELHDGHTVIWLENDVGITQSGGAVSKWTDITNGYELIPYATDGGTATSANYPTWTEAGGVVFDGTDDVLKYMVSGWTTLYGSIYAVVKQVSWVNDGVLFSYGGVGGTRVNQRTQSPYIVVSNSSGRSVPITDFAINTWGLITLEVDGANNILTIQLGDGTPVQNSADANGFTSGGIILGATHAAAPALQRYGNVAIYAIVVRDAIDNATTKAAIKAYLTNKYL